jgi:protease IV
MINQYSTVLFMKTFFKFVFASMLGFILSSILMFFLLIGIVSVMVSSGSDKKIKVEKGSILHIDFKQELEDRTNDNSFENFDFTSMESRSQIGLNDILKNLKKASADPHVEGIYLDLSGGLGGMASVEELRNGLIEFKKSKKFILAYSDYYTQGNYYVASVADEIWVHPEGVVDFRGLSTQLPFLKGMFEKLEIEPQVIRHGKFKSAIEPFVLDKMSDENREQTAKFIDSFWNHMIAEVAFARKISEEELKSIANEMKVQTAEDALKMKMTDKVGYKDEFLAVLMERTGKSSSKDLKMVSMSKYTKAPEQGPEKEFTRDQIAVIYATGDIVGGKGSSDQIGSESLSETIRKAREDEKVKAVVLRVNSSGGDALASDVIWREVVLTKKEKPVIVSMGDVAASGGYYISCGADAIIAQPNTITGSIGVFGLMFNIGEMMKNKVGVTFDGYKTGTFADLGNMTRPLNEAERAIMQNSVERVYSTFTGKVSEGRKMPVAMVDSVGQGRVWSGVDAMSLGLVDTLGGLEDAIAMAAKKAKLDNYRISELPEKKDPFEQFIKEMSEGAETRWLKYRLGDYYGVVNDLKYLSKYQGIQARMMHMIDHN